MITGGVLILVVATLVYLVVLGVYLISISRKQ